MDSDQLLQHLSYTTAIALQATNFSTSGTLNLISPGLEVTGMGHVEIPLSPATIEQLLLAGTPAPFGLGERTLIDPKVRRTLQLTSDQFQITNPAWESQLQSAVHEAAVQLGLPGDRLKARVDKLLLYSPGDFFLTHRDSEKVDRMLASLIVVLPSQFTGGRLMVRHDTAERHYRFEQTTEQGLPTYVAFYADCEHQVEPIRSGFRLSLTYQLVLDSPYKGQASAPRTPDAELVETIDAWCRARPNEPLIFALNHDYTRRGLKPDLMKGVDRQKIEMLLSATEKAGCMVALCGVDRHTSFLIDEDDDWDREDDDPDIDEFQIDGVLSDKVRAVHWTDAQGEPLPFPSQELSVNAIVAARSIEDWKPSRQKYRGYTGNEGYAFDRWYHRSAICIWRPDSPCDLRIRSGTSE